MRRRTVISKADLKSELFFKIGCQPRLYRPVYLAILLIVGRKQNIFLLFRKVIVQIECKMFMKRFHFPGLLTVTPLTPTIWWVMAKVNGQRRRINYFSFYISMFWSLTLKKNVWPIKGSRNKEGRDGYFYQYSMNVRGLIKGFHKIIRWSL